MFTPNRFRFLKEKKGTMIRGKYTDGKRNGVWEWYDESGELVKTSYYQMGKLLG